MCARFSFLAVMSSSKILQIRRYTHSVIQVILRVLCFATYRTHKGVYIKGSEVERRQVKHIIVLNTDCVEISYGRKGSVEESNPRGNTDDIGRQQVQDLLGSGRVSNN